jgi:hypothetical protein
MTLVEIRGFLFKKFWEKLSFFGYLLKTFKHGKDYKIKRNRFE